MFSKEAKIRADGHTRNAKSRTRVTGKCDYKERECKFHLCTLTTVKIDKFLPEVALLKQKLKKKKSTSKQVIAEKMKELHQLVDKWEQRLVETASETITEKIEKLAKQVALCIF
jgi:hypothetical protein